MERDLFKDHATVLRDHFLNEWSRNSRFLVSEKQKMMMVSGGGFKKKKFIPQLEACLFPENYVGTSIFLKEILLLVYR